MTNTEIELAKEMGRFYDDPVGFVLFAFPWDTDSKIQQVAMPEKYQEKYGVIYGPDEWAINFLEKLGNSVTAANDPTSEINYPLQFSTASGHGIGKTTLVAWLILWIMSTRPFCKGIVTANTQTQLRSKTWSELSKWLNMCITKHWFVFNSGRGNLKIAHIDYSEEWNCEAQTSKEENSESFAGLHAASSTPFYIFDEASAVSDKIFEVREGGTTDGEAMTFDFGNPTKNSGRFFENTIGRFSHRYITASIDSRDVKVVKNKKQIEEWIEDYGIDSDFVKVRVKGVFPSVGDRQYINSDDVQASMDAPSIVTNYAPLVIGVDVARFGGDLSVIYPRMGRDARSFEPTVLSGFDVVQVAGRVIEIVRNFRTIGRQCAAIFVDGNGVGGGVVDILRHADYHVIEILAQHRPRHPEQYKSKTDEVWGDLKEAIRGGLLLPARTTNVGTQLYSELTQREYDFTPNGQIKLESKEDMKKRGLDSPNISDALTLTYAQEINWDIRVQKPMRFTAHNDLSHELWGGQAQSYDDNIDVYRQRGYGSANLGT